MGADGADMSVLILHPKLGFTEDNANVETPVQLGDGYLIVGRVKSSDRKSYSISGVLTEQELEEIIATFEQYAGGVKFQWSPIPELGLRDFWCQSWDATPLGADWSGYRWEFSAKLEEAR